MSVSVRQVRAAAITSGGPTQDFTVAGFGTPKAAVVIVTLATADGISANAAALSFGIVSNNVADGLKQFSVAMRADDAVDTMNTCHRSSNTKCVCLLGAATTIDAEASATFIADGVQLTWSDFPATAVFVTCILFTGTDLSTHAGDFTASANINTETIITTPNFPVDQVILMGSLSTTYNVTESVAFVESGIAVGFSDRGAPVRQSGLACASVDGASSSNATDVANDAWANDTPRDGPEWYAIDLTTYTAVGFSVITRGNGGAFQYPYLALGFNGTCNHWNGVVDSPIGTGLQSFTAPAFKPQFVLALTSGVSGLTTSATRNVMKVSTTGAGTFGISAFTATETFSNSIGDDDAALTSDTDSWSRNIFTCRNDSKQFIHQGTFSSFDTLGWTLNISQTNSIVRKWPCLVIGEFNAGGGVTHAGAAVLATAFTVSPAGRVTYVAQAALSSAITVAAAGKPTYAGQSAITGVFSITAAGSLTLVGQADIASAFTITADAMITREAQAALSSVFAVTASGLLELPGAATVEAALTVSAIGSFIYEAAAAISCSLTVGPNAVVQASGQSTINGIFSVTATGTTADEHFGQAVISATFTVAGVASVTYAANAASLTAFTTAANAILNLAAKAAPSAVFTTAANGKITLSGKAAVNTIWTITASSSLTNSGKAVLPLVFTVSPVGVITLGGKSVIATLFTTSAVPVATYAGQSASTGIFVVAALPVASYTARAALSGNFSVIAVGSLEAEVAGTWNSYGVPHLYIVADNIGLTYALETYMRATAGRVNARMYNETDAVAVSGSELFTESAAFTRQRTGSVALIDGKVYRSQFARSTGGAGEVLSAAPVIV